MYHRLIYLSIKVALKPSKLGELFCWSPRNTQLLEGAEPSLISKLFWKLNCLFRVPHRQLLLLAEEACESEPEI